jgi:hypothetical protein
MSEEEDAAAILDCVGQIETKTLIISAALTGMTPKQKSDTRTDLEAALYCVNNATESAGIP